MMIGAQVLKHWAEPWKIPVDGAAEEDDHSVWVIIGQVGGSRDHASTQGSHSPRPSREGFAELPTLL